MVAVLDSFKTRVGPLPLWAWTAVPAGGFIIYSYWKSRQGDDGPPLVMEDQLEGDEGANDEYLNTGLPSIGAGSSIPGYQSAPNGSSNLPATNESWFNKALNYLVGQGKNPLDVNQALSAFIYGTPAVITSEQRELINQAIKDVGAPPTAGYTPSVGTQPEPPAEAAKKPPPKVASVRLGAQSKGTIVLGWNSVNEPIIAYRVEYEEQKKPGIWTVRTTTSTGITLTGLAPGTYKVRVAAVNSAGRGTWTGTPMIKVS